METEKKLIDNLEAMKEEYEKLRDAAARKQEAIFERDLETIQKLTRAEELLTGQLRELGDRQRWLWAEISGYDCQKIITLELEDLLVYLDSEFKDRYVKKRIELKFILRDLQRISSENINLLENRLGDLNELFKAVFEELGVEGGEETYDKKLNDNKNKQKTSMLIDRAI